MGVWIPWTPFLRPSTLESSFWASDVYQIWCSKLDSWTVGTTLVQNGLFCILHAFLPSASNIKVLSNNSVLFWVILASAQFCMLLALSQLLLRKWYKDCYSKWRFYALASHRVARFCLFLAVVMLCRNTDRHEHLQRQLQQNAPPYLPSSLLAIRSIAMASLALLALVHGYTVPLPFLPQLLVHTVYLVFMVQFHLPAAVSLLGSGDDEFFSEACEWLSATAVTFEAAAAGYTSDLTLHWNLCQSSKAKLALLLFLMVFVGTFLPVYFSYRLELHAKLLFLHSIGMDTGELDVEHFFGNAHEDASWGGEGALVGGADEQGGDVSRGDWGDSVSLGEQGGGYSSGGGRGELFGSVDGEEGTREPLLSEDEDDEAFEGLGKPMLHISMQDVLVIAVVAVLCWIFVVMWMDSIVAVTMPV